MDVSKLRVVLCLMIAVVGTTNAEDHVFEFGDTQGQEYYVNEGIINIFTFNTIIEIPKVNNHMLTGVKVTVSGVSTPKVTFDPPKVHIVYKFPQWTYSNYKIIAKGLHSSN